MSGSLTISAAVEGDVDEVVVQKLILAAGATPGTVYGKRGKPYLCQKINGFNNAAQYSPWIVLVDLDRDYDCAPLLRNTWLPNPGRLICFRIAVRAVEAWLIADRTALANYLRIAPSRIPQISENLDDPKREMVNLARRSRKKTIRLDMVPRDGSGRAIGPAYTSRMMEYVEKHWRPERAAQQSDSLRRALKCLKRLVKEAS